MAPVRIDHSLRPGLAFMTLHFPDEVETNVLTIDATDPKSGTAEFKATAIRVEKLNGDGAVTDGDAAHGAAPPAHGSLSMDLRLLLTIATDGRERRRSTPCSARPRRPGTAAPAASRTATSARGGHAAREQRHLLLPALHAVQAASGWISGRARTTSAERLTVPPAEAYGVATLLRAVLARAAAAPRRCTSATTSPAGADGSEQLIAGARGARRSEHGPRATAHDLAARARASASASRHRRRCS